MLKVKKIINDAPSSNMYVLFEEGQNNAFLIDVGDVKVLFNELPKDLNILFMPGKWVMLSLSLMILLIRKNVL